MIFALLLVLASSLLPSSKIEKLEFDFSRSPEREFFSTFHNPGTGEIDHVAFALKVPFRHRILLRVTDATGQIFQRELCPVTGVWWPYRESLIEQWDFVYGGAKDNVVHQPVRSFDIYVHNPKLPRMHRDAVLIRDVEFVRSGCEQLPKLAVTATYGTDTSSSSVKVEVKAGRRSFTGGKLAVRWSDWEGDAIKIYAVECPAIVAGGTWSTELPFARLPVGKNAMFAKVALKGEDGVVRADGPAWARRPRPVVDAGRANADSPFGVGIYCQRWGVNSWALDRQIRPLIESARDAGFKWMRDQIVWDHVEKDGRLDFSGYDAIFDVCRKNGMSLCMLFGGPGKGAKWTDADYCDKYCAALRKAVRHYRGKVAAWELCNEPNLPWPPDPRWRENYLKLLTLATRVVHEEDPLARTVGGSASGLGIGWLRELKDQGHDDVSIHPYRRYMDEPEFLADMEDAVVAAGNRTIWMTEIGWTGWYKPYGDDRLSMEEQPIGFREQATQLARAYLASAAAKGVKVVFGYDYVDDGFQACGHERHMGIVHGEYQTGFLPKPAYLALANICSHFKSGEATMECREDGIVVFRMNGNEAIWSRTREPIRYRVAKGGELTNLMGEKLDLPAEANGDTWISVNCENVVLVRRQ